MLLKFFENWEIGFIHSLFNVPDIYQVLIMCSELCYVLETQN